MSCNSRIAIDECIIPLCHMTLMHFCFHFCWLYHLDLFNNIRLYVLWIACIKPARPRAESFKTANCHISKLVSLIALYHWLHCMFQQLKVPSTMIDWLKIQIRLTKSPLQELTLKWIDFLLKSRIVSNATFSKWESPNVYIVTRRRAIFGA